jgi:anthranilate phosphoribosyltransferase
MTARATPALIKHVARGARLAKDLPLEEARELMARILSGEADEVQTGAFLAAMRMKGESAEELAGFVLALRAGCTLPARAALPASANLVDVDLHADGREDRPSLTLASACVAAACGARVLVRGWFGSAFARNDVGDAFARLGVTPGADLGGLGAGVAVIDLAAYAPRIAALLALRERIGVRTCIHSAVKLLDPLGTGRLLVGIFHSPYHAPVSGAALRLGVVRAAVVQAPGGVPEIAPDKPTRTTLLDAGQASEPAPLPLPTAAAAPTAEGGAAPLPSAPDAAALAALLESILRAPAAAPASAVRATALGAALMLWVAGLAPEPLAAFPRAAAVLADGGGARMLDEVRLLPRNGAP